MKKTKILLGITLSFCTTVWAQNTCFLAQEDQKKLKQEGNDCATRYTPQSTFKIALSLMGFDSGILTDALHPEWPYKKDYELYLNVWKYPHNPSTWIRDSCVWYSQELTKKLGMQKFKSYVDAFHYGNEDVSGDKGKHNGLTHSWLSSSLAISPLEQIQFLQKIVTNQLPVSQKALNKTKDILYIQELTGGWKLYGKTGTGELLTKDKNKQTLHQGWFIGWIEKDDRRVTFVNHITDCKENFAGLKARNEAQIKLFYLINELEK